MDDNTVEGTVRDFTGRGKEALGAAAGDAKLQAEGKVDQIVGAGQKAYGSAREAVREGADQASAAADSMAGAVSDAARRAGHQAAELGDRAYAEASNMGKYANERVKEQPLAALLLAGIVGGVIGHLLSSSRR